MSALVPQTAVDDSPRHLCKETYLVSVYDDGNDKTEHGASACLARLPDNDSSIPAAATGARLLGMHRCSIDPTGHAE